MNDHQRRESQQQPHVGGETTLHDKITTVVNDVIHLMSA